MTTYRLNDTHTFRFTTTNASTGAAQNADSLPVVNVYEEATDTPTLVPTAVNVATGHYRVPIAMTTGNGFEAGKNYVVEVQATVSTVAGKGIIATFKVEARQLDDLAFPAVSGNSLAVENDGMVHGDLKEWLGVAPAALTSQLVQSQVVGMNTNTLTAAALAADAASEVGAATWAVTSLIGGKSYGLLINELNLAQILRVAQLQVGSTTQSVVLDASASATDDYYNRTTITMATGAAAGQNRLINDYDGATRTAYLDRPFLSAAPGTGDWFAIDSRGNVRSASDLRIGLAQAGGPSTITLQADESALNNFYNRMFILIESGTGANQARLIDAYDGGTRVATVARPWVTQPDATSRYVILPFGSVKVSDIDADAITAASIAAGAITSSEAPALANLDAAVSTRAVPGDQMALINDAITDAKIAAGAITASEAPALANLDAAVSTRSSHSAADVWAVGTREVTGGVVASVSGAVGSVSGNVGGNVVGSVGSVAGNVSGNVVGSVGSVAADGLTNASFAAETGLKTIRSNTAQAGGTNTITLDASASSTANLYQGLMVYLTSGTGVGQVRLITAYNGTSKIATVSMDWGVQPVAGTTFALLPQSSILNLANNAIRSASLAAETGLQPARSDIAVGGGPTSITLDAGASSTNDYYAGLKVYLTGGTGVGQSRLITAYNGTSKVATVSRAWTTEPIGGTTFALLPQTAVIGVDGNISGNLVGSVGSIGASGITSGSFAAGAINASAIATDAIGAAELAADAVSEIASGVWSAGTREITGGTITTVGDKTGYALSASGVEAVSDDVWDEPLAEHLLAGSTGAALNSASSAGDPWATALPGAYGAGTAGNILGNRLDVAVSTRSSHAAADVWAVGARTITGGTITTLGAGSIASSSFASGAITRDALAADTGLQTLRSNTAQGGSANTITLDASASSVASFYVGSRVYITSGTGVGQVRVITQYDGGTKVATVPTNWITQPVSGSTFAILDWAASPGVVGNVTGNVTGSVGSVAGNVVGSVGSVAGNVTGSVGSVLGNVGGNVVGSVGSVAGNVVGSVGSVAGNVGGNVVGNVSGNVVGSVGSVAGNVVGSVGSVVGHTPQTGDSFALIGAAGAGLTAVPWNAAWSPNVNAEVVDVLRVDTIPDSYPADGAQPTIAQALLAIQQFLGDKVVAGTTVTVRKPDGVSTAMTFTLDQNPNPTSITRAP